MQFSRLLYCKKEKRQRYRKTQRTCRGGERNPASFRGINHEVYKKKHRFMAKRYAVLQKSARAVLKSLGGGQKQMVPHGKAMAQF